MRSVGRATHDIRQEPRGGDVMVANIGFTIISPLTRLRICYWPFPHAAHGVSDNPRGSAAPSHNKHFYALHIRRGARTPVRGPDRGLCRETSGQAPRLLGRCPASAGRWLCRGELCLHSIRGAQAMSRWTCVHPIRGVQAMSQRPGVGICTYRQVAPVGDTDKMEMLKILQ